MKTEGDALSGHQGRKEGRKYYICSSRLGLIRWDIIQHVKAVHDKMSNTSDVHLPHELLHCASNIGKQCSILVAHSLQSRALKYHVAFVPNSMLVTVLTQAPVTRGACAAAQNNREAVGTQPEPQQNTHATSTEGLHQQGPRPPQGVRPSKPPEVCTQSGTGRRACPRADINPQSGLEGRGVQELQ